MYFDRRCCRRFPVHSILMWIVLIKCLMVSAHPAQRLIVCLSLESSKGKHALIILYDKCKLWPLRRRWVLDWSIFGRDVESLYNCPTCIRLSPFAVHWPLSGRPITEVRSSGCKISQSQALCLFALFLGFPLSVIVRLRSFNVGVILKIPPTLPFK